jgi:hypothetical protein
MLNEHEAVELLYHMVYTEPYNSAGSWTSTREFTQDIIECKTQYPFVLDERFARPDSNASTGTRL